LGSLQEACTMAIKMELSRIFIQEMADVQIIELSEVDGSRSFPIVVGLPEAFAIQRRLKGIEVPRPQTHDLLASVIEAMDGALVEIRINDLADGTFFANLIIEHNGRILEIDSRPSDAIAVGIALNVPIFVAERVLDQVEIDPAIQADIDAFDDLPESSDDDDIFG
jgi:bifunctional DNase/RNase